MFLLLVAPLALVLIVLSVLGLAGVGPLTSAQRSDRDGFLRTVGPAVGLMAGLGLLALAAIGSLLFIGVGGVDAPDEDDERSSPTSAPTTSTTTPSVPNPAVVATPRRAAVLGPVVTIEADEGDTFPKTYDVADRLRAESVLRVHARGFPPFAK